MHVAWQQQTKNICKNLCWFLYQCIHLFICECVSHGSCWLGGDHLKPAWKHSVSLSPADTQEQVVLYKCHTFSSPEGMYSLQSSAACFILSQILLPLKESLWPPSHPSPSHFWAKSETVKVPDNVQLSGCSKLCHAFPVLPSASWAVWARIRKI